MTSGTLASHTGRRFVREPRNWPELRADAARLWHERRMVLINPDDVRDDLMRQAIINEANRQYGEPR